MNKREIICVDNPHLEENTTRRFPLSDPLQITFLGFKKILELITTNEKRDLRAEYMRSKMIELARGNSAWVGGLFHIPKLMESASGEHPITFQQRDEVEWELGVVHPFSYPHLIVDPPFFVASFWLHGLQFRHHEALIDLLRQAKEAYVQKFDEEVGLGLLKRVVQYARNLALQDNHVFPSLFNLVEAAKGGCR